MFFRLPRSVHTACSSAVETGGDPPLPLPRRRAVLQGWRQNFGRAHWLLRSTPLRSRPSSQACSLLLLRQQHSILWYRPWPRTTYGLQTKPIQSGTGALSSQSCTLASNMSRRNSERVPRAPRSSSQAQGEHSWRLQTCACRRAVRAWGMYDAACSCTSCRHASAQDLHQLRTCSRLRNDPTKMPTSIHPFLSTRVAGWEAQQWSCASSGPTLCRGATSQPTAMCLTWRPTSRTSFTRRDLLKTRLCTHPVLCHQGQQLVKEQATANEHLGLWTCKSVLAPPHAAAGRV